ncbi:TPA: hypothetical protein N0F65_011776 [Lagenidium giganteum]|uniref:Uncharacterized protein n=1 Tax=Lagenidium giganteum TaxID=4803 RepID=A0AAV2YEE6_9STRA|nr:TPA: hypothetical protein N0F65_011776 [Lagenidium giganteum]
MSIGLLASSAHCRSCARPMKLARRNTLWRCSRRECDTSLSVRAGTIFSASRLPMGNWCNCYSTLPVELAQPKRACLLV